MRQSKSFTGVVAHQIVFSGCYNVRRGGFRESFGVGGDDHLPVSVVGKYSTKLKASLIIIERY